MYKGHNGDRKSTRLNSSHSQIFARSLHDALPILAIAQPQSPSQPMGAQAMTCTKVDDSGYCIEAKGPDEKMIVVRTEGVKVGEKLTCTTTGTSTTCTKVTTEIGRAHV